MGIESAVVSRRAWEAAWNGRHRGPATADEAASPILARAALRQSQYAVRASWSKALGSMRELMRLQPALVFQALSAQERSETDDLLEEWRAWGSAYAKAAVGVV